MRPYDRFRWLAVALLAVAAVLSALGRSHRQGWLTALTFVAFAAAVASILAWRRAARRHRATVFDREAKTPDETRPGPDR